MSPQPPTAVVFDLGGVLARICHSWQEAAEVAGVTISLPGSSPIALTDFVGFDEYQAGRLPLQDYLRELGLYLGCSASDAEGVHNSIIVEEHPGVAELVGELRERGCRLGCLSNTNALHWEHLAVNGLYPTIETLEMKMASHLVGLNKPDPEIFRVYMSTYGLEPVEVAYFDDHKGNVAAANSEGWLAALIRPGDDTPSQMRKMLVEWGIL